MAITFKTTVDYVKANKQLRKELEPMYKATTWKAQVEAGRDVLFTLATSDVAVDPVIKSMVCTTKHRAKNTRQYNEEFYVLLTGLECVCDYLLFAAHHQQKLTEQNTD